MRTPVLPRDRALSHVAERQMRAWALSLQNQEQRVIDKTVQPLHRLINPYLVISREAGASGSDIAHTVADRCGWKVLDSELLDYMVEQEHLSRLALDMVDEKAASWFYEVFGKWLDQDLVSQAEYVSRMGRVILLAVQHESTVFVGRGSQFLLPREAGIAVRIIAPRKQRIKRIMETRQCSRDEAEAFIDETDQGRAQFVERYFHHDVADARLYDLVVNLRYMSPNDAADLIVAQCQRRFALT